jgi:hypothetical protein
MIWLPTWISTTAAKRNTQYGYSRTLTRARLCAVCLQVVDVARFTKTAGAIDFNWGANTGAAACANVPAAVLLMTCLQHHCPS